jgi:hypothetical protein
MRSYEIVELEVEECECDNERVVSVEEKIYIRVFQVP